MTEFEGLTLFTPEEYALLPAGFVLTCIDGSTKVKGIDEIDDDTRFGHIAFGIVGKPMDHPEAELLTRIRLTVK